MMILKLILLTVILLHSVPGMSVIFSKGRVAPFVDPRERFDRSIPELNAIGNLAITGVRINLSPTPVTGYGTGFLINKCLVMTSAHVVTLASQESFISGRHIEFQSGKFQSTGEVVVVTDFAIKKGEYTGSSYRGKDWAVIKLKKAAPKNWKLNPVFTTMKEAGRNPVDIAGYMTDIPSSTSSEELWGEKNCKIWGKGTGDFKGTWVTDCAGIPGVSGSPILGKVLDENNNIQEYFAYGVMSSVRNGNKTAIAPNAINMNDFIPFTEMVDSNDVLLGEEGLQEIIKKHGCK